MTPQLIAPLIQLPLVDPQLLGQLLGTAALHPLHRSPLLFPTPTSISLPTLHSMLHGEFSSCLLLGGHSNDYADSGSFHTGSVTDAYCAGVQRTQRGENASYRHGRGRTVGISRLRPQSPAPRDPSVSARNDKFAIYISQGYWCHWQLAKAQFIPELNRGNLRFIRVYLRQDAHARAKSMNPRWGSVLTSFTRTLSPT